MQRQEFDQTAHASLTSEALPHLDGFFPGNTGDLRKLFRLIFQNLQRMNAKKLQDFFCGLFADALDCAGGQIRKDLVAGLRHQPLQKLRLELAAMARMVAPFSRHDQAFAGNGHGDSSNDCDLLAVLRVQPQDGVSVFRILIDDRLDRPSNHFFQLLHVYDPVLNKSERRSSGRSVTNSHFSQSACTIRPPVSLSPTSNR